MSDPIDRQTAIDAFANYIYDVNKIIGTRKLSVHECEDIASRVLKKLPSTQPERKWIPVTERLPENDTDFIVSCTDDSGDFEFSYTTTGWHFKGVWVVDNERSYFVRAWMPLPEPYNEDEQNG